MSKWIVMLFASLLTCQAGMSKLEAISMIETGNNDRAVGGAGEISRYQIKPYIWKRYTSSNAYQNADVAARVAQQYLETLEAHFARQAGREPTDFDRYVLWNGGPSYYKRVGYVSRKVHPVIRGRAQRFVNLCQLNIGSQDARARYLASLSGPR